VVELLRVWFAAFDIWLLRVGGMSLMIGGGRWLFCFLFFFLYLSHGKIGLKSEYKIAS